MPDPQARGSAGTKIFVSGPPAVGKTTLIRTLALELGSRAAGFYTEEVRRRGSRVGFDIVVLGGGRFPLGRKAGTGGLRVGAYQVDVSALENVVLALLTGAARERKVLVIDEVGKMELLSSAFESFVSAAIDGEAPIIASYGIFRHPLIGRIEAHQGIERYRLTRANRDRTLSKLRTRLMDLS